MNVLIKVEKKVNFFLFLFPIKAGESFILRPPSKSNKKTLLILTDFFFYFVPVMVTSDSERKFESKERAPCN